MDKALLGNPMTGYTINPDLKVPFNNKSQQKAKKQTNK
jgi:hypothetical protein